MPGGHATDTPHATGQHYRPGTLKKSSYRCTSPGGVQPASHTQKELSPQALGKDDPYQSPVTGRVSWERALGGRCESCEGGGVCRACESTHQGQSSCPPRRHAGFCASSCSAHRPAAQMLCSIPACSCAAQSTRQHAAVGVRTFLPCCCFTTVGQQLLLGFGPRAPVWRQFRSSKAHVD